MTLLDRRKAAPPEGIGRVEPDESSQPEKKGGRGGHGHWMMVACCIPMLVIAVTLVATGVAGAGVIFIAVMCTAMMAMMMVGMSRGGGQQ